jgi:acyl-CoA synthetase (AMP-forming)/AMP-acid ligase II
MLTHFRLGSIIEIHTGRRIQSDELKTAIDRRGRELTDAGLRHAQTVVIYQNNSIDFFINLLAVWSVGGCAAPLDGALPPVVKDQLQAILSAGLIIEPSNEIRFIAGAPSTSGALRLMTSGSSGVPKVITHTLQSVRLKVEVLANMIPARELQRTLCALPTFFGHGLVGNSLLPLLTGHDLFLADGFTLPFIAGIDDLLCSKKITFMSSTPIVWNLVEQFASASASAKPDLVRVHCASAPMGRRQTKTMHEWSPKTEFWNVYGLTNRKPLDKLENSGAQKRA